MVLYMELLYIIIVFIILVYHIITCIEYFIKLIFLMIEKYFKIEKKSSFFFFFFFFFFIKEIIFIFNNIFIKLMNLY